MDRFALCCVCNLYIFFTVNYVWLLDARKISLCILSALGQSIIVEPNKNKLEKLDLNKSAHSIIVFSLFDFGNK